VKRLRSGSVVEVVSIEVVPVAVDRPLGRIERAA